MPQHFSSGCGRGHDGPNSDETDAYENIEALRDDERFVIARSGGGAVDSDLASTARCRGRERSHQCPVPGLQSQFQCAPKTARRDDPGRHRRAALYSHGHGRLAHG